MLSIGRKQIGFIVFGAGMNKRAWIMAERDAGRLVVDYGAYALIFA